MAKKKTAQHNLGRSLLSLSAEQVAYYYDHWYDLVCDQILKSVWDEIRPSWQQKQVLDEICAYPKVLVDAGHGTGRSTVFTWAAMCFFATRPSPCRIPCTAPTGHQIKDILWSNFSRWINTSNISDDFDWMATEIKHKIMEQPHFILSRTSNKSSNMQGQHEKHLLWIADECYGIMDPLVWETINGSLTQGKDNKLLMGGQPFLVSGYCADARNKKKSPNWRQLRHNSEDAPEEIIDKEWVAEMYRKWGRDSDVCRVRVRGLPPLGNPRAFIPLALVMQMVGREIDKDGPFEIGVDPAHEGDDRTALAYRKGYYYYPIEYQSKTDEFQIVAMVLNRVRLIRSEHNYVSKIRVKIENIGGYGFTAIKILQQNRTDNIEVVPITSGGGGNKEYATAATVMWGEFRDAGQKIHLPEGDDDLIGQLSTREYDYDLKTNRVILEPKKKYKSRTKGVSPDGADAVILCWTRQAIRTRMLDFELNQCVSRLIVSWDSLSRDTKPVVGLWLDESGKMGAIIGLWKPETRKLYCIFAAEYEKALPELAIPALTASMVVISRGRVANLSRFEWVGNKPFDEVGMGSVRDAWARHGVQVQFNDRYEFDGAVMALGRMFKRQTLVFDETHANQLPAALQAWYVEERDDTAALVLALANLASCFYDEKEIGPDNALRPYTERKAEAQEEANKKVLEDKGINMPEEYVPPKEGWVI